MEYFEFEIELNGIIVNGSACGSVGSEGDSRWVQGSEWPESVRLEEVYAYLGDPDNEVPITEEMRESILDNLWDNLPHHLAA